MKKILQKILTISFLLFIFYCNISAQAFSATYVNDLNGNRIKETVIYLKTTLQSKVIPLDSVLKKDTIARDTTKLPQEGWENGPRDSSSNMKISIYPNPTHGILLVEIGGIDANAFNNANNIIRLTDINGKELITVKPLDYNNIIDMSTLPAAVYIINISINGNIKNYKVIKN